MGSATFTPQIYVKDKCPFCMKVKIFLLEAGLLNQVEILTHAQGSDGEKKAKATLEANGSSQTFPAAEVAPGRFLTDSNAIVAHFADSSRIDISKLPVFTSYTTGVLQQISTLWKENVDLKKRVWRDENC